MLWPCSTEGETTHELGVTGTKTHRVCQGAAVSLVGQTTTATRAKR